MKKIITALILAASALVAQAQNFTVATGDFKGGSTYSRMFRELQAKCNRTPGVPLLEERETNGGATNMALVAGNQVAGAIVPTDMLFFTKMTDEAKVANIRTLFTLHPEELHFVARADVKKEGGYLGGLVGGQKVSYNNVADLAGRPVGAVGGSVYSGRVFSQQSKLNFSVVEFPNNEALKNALLSKQVDAILVVGGAPHALVSSLDQQYRLLEVSPDTQKAVGNLYKSAKLSYGNLNQAGVNTVATQAQFVTRVWRSDDMQKSLKALRECFTKNLPVIQDTLGTHPKWALVNSDDKGPWTYYDLK